ASADKVCPCLRAGANNLGIRAATETLEDVGSPRDRVGYAQAETSQACDDAANHFGFGAESFANALRERLDRDGRTCPGKSAELLREARSGRKIGTFIDRRSERCGAKRGERAEHALEAGIVSATDSSTL